MKPPDRGSALPLHTALHRVAYFSEDQLLAEFDQVLHNIKENRDFLREALPNELLAHMAYRWLMITIVSLKHKGFFEEDAWRLIYSPTQYVSTHMEQETITLDGIPQLIYKLPLINKPDQNISGIEIPELLDRIIIGPTPYASTIFESILKELIKLGVENANQKIFVSDIPIR